jgi:hypothetical protein
MWASCYIFHFTTASVRIRWVGEVMRCCWLQPMHSITMLRWEKVKKDDIKQLWASSSIYISYSSECQKQVGWRSNEVLLAPQPTPSPLRWEGAE